VVGDLRRFIRDHVEISRFPRAPERRLRILEVLQRERPGCSHAGRGLGGWSGRVLGNVFITAGTFAVVTARMVGRVLGRRA
jgi:hypothetical protein